MPPFPPILPTDQTLPPLTSTPPPDILSTPGQTPQTSTAPPPSTTNPRTLHIGTRASALALAQVSIFTSILTSLHPDLPTQTIPISVAGDRDKTTDLHTLAQMGKSLWTEEMEVMLLNGEIDCIVHSLKDVPTKVVEGCEVVVVGERGERRDCVVFPVRDGVNEREEEEQAALATTVNSESSPTLPATEEVANEAITTAPATTTAPAHGRPLTSSSSSSPPLSPTKKRKISPASSSNSAPPTPQPPPPPARTLSSLPPSSVVGTSSIRRSAMIRRRYPSLLIQDMRGNVGTRLRKLDDPAHGFDCAILAGAGIQRVGMGHRVSEWLGPDIQDFLGDGEGEDEGDTQDKADSTFLHAVGQGAIGLEIRAGDEWMRSLLLAPQENGTPKPKQKRGVVVLRTSWECQAERSLLRTLEGGCSVPVGVYCVWEEEEEHTEKDDEASDTITAHKDEGEEEEEEEGKDDTDPLAMQPGTLYMLASVTSVDGTEHVAAARRQWVGSDGAADEAGWQLARVLVEKGAERILREIGLNRGMVERGDGA